LQNSSSSLIYLPKSLAEGEDPDNEQIVYCVAAFTNDMLYKGLFLPNELPKNSMQLYYTDYYYGQVQNGGHSQFIENGLEDDLKEIITGALQGFAAMGANGHAKILTEFESWLRDNAFLAQWAEEPGFDDETWELLEEFDDRLNEANEETPIEDLQAKWLLSWENLRIVDDAEVAEIRKAQLKSNPLLLPRKIKMRISSLLANDD